MGKSVNTFLMSKRLAHIFQVVLNKNLCQFYTFFEVRERRIIQGVLIG